MVFSLILIIKEIDFELNSKMKLIFIKFKL